MMFSTLILAGTAFSAAPDTTANLRTAAEQNKPTDNGGKMLRRQTGGQR
jgi:hypothetical protein